MAIYWIDPHTTVNGTGTFASPYSLTSQTRASLSSGDEVRLKGVALTSLLTATVYTATYTNNYQLTITAGGGLGADFAAGDIIYLPDSDTFFRVNASAANVITGGGGNSLNMLPWYNTSAGQTTITVRRVDTATYGTSSTSTLYFWYNSTNVSNITFSDCWTSATTRVTDGTVKSLITTSSTSSVTFYLDSFANTATIPTNRVYSFDNTHAICGTGSAYYNFYVYARSFTLTFGQLYAHSSSAFINFGALPWGVSNVTATFKHLTEISPRNGLVGDNITFTIQKYAVQSVGYFITGPGATSLNRGSNVTITIGDGATYFSQAGQGGVFNVANSTITGTTINYNGYIDQYSSTSFSGWGMVSAGGDYTVNFGSSFVFYQNRRASTITSATYWFYPYTTPSTGYQPYVFIPNVATPPGFTYTTTTSLLQWNFTAAFRPQTNLVPFVSQVSMPNTSYLLNLGSGYLNNLLLTFRDGSNPVEQLGIFTRAAPNTNTSSNAENPQVTLDATVFRTTGPSLKSNLTTRNASFWNIGVDYSRSVKPIKIPVVAGSTYTVSGYVKSDIATFVNGDCRIRIVFNNTTILGSQSISGTYSNWNPFSITFTASTTGEATLCWEMYYSSAGAYWLDDLTIA